jgi:putative transposase
VVVVDPEHPTRKAAFLFKRDPRDISVIYFLVPTTRSYCPVPYRNPAYPAISIWELRQAQRKIRELHKGQIDETMIFETIQRLRSIESTAVAATAKARRNLARKRLHQDASHNSQSLVQALSKTTPGQPSVNAIEPDPSVWSAYIQPFEEEPSASERLFKKPINP